MKTRIFSLVAAVALTIYAGAASAQQLSLVQISDYLNGLRTAQGTFTQINADGSMATGQIYIKRPGRIRFEYSAPDDTLVMAGGGQLAIFDPRSNAGPDRYPVSRTPLNIILRRDVDLAAEEMVTNVVSDGATTTVTAQDPEHPEYGSIQLVFDANPIALRQWIILDDMGGQTVMVLNDLQQDVAIGDVLFNIRSEMRRRGF